MAGRAVEPGIVAHVSDLVVRPPASIVVVVVRVAFSAVSTVMLGASQMLYAEVRVEGRLAGPFAGVAVVVGAARGPVAHGRPAHSGLSSHRESSAEPSAV
jgi:hypothetical protein